MRENSFVFNSDTSKITLDRMKYLFFCIYQNLINYIFRFVHDLGSGIWGSSKTPAFKIKFDCKKPPKKLVKSLCLQRQGLVYDMALTKDTCGRTNYTGTLCFIMSRAILKKCPHVFKT